jgi:subtilisin family serine protease
MGGKLAWFALLTLVPVLAVEAGPRRYVSPAIAARLASPGVGGPIRAIVRLRPAGAAGAAGAVARSAADPATLLDGVRGPAQPDALLALRRAQALAGCAGLLAWLDARRQPGPWAQARPPAHRSLWIANSIAIEASPAMIGEIAARPDVESVVEDRRVRALPPAARRRARDAGAEGAWALARLRADEVHRAGLDGSGVVVGHIDTGVDGAHPSIARKVIAFRDFTGGTPPRERSGRPSGRSAASDAYDDDGHGTHTAGLIAATPGVVGGTACGGTAPGARLVVAKALDARGEGEISTLLEAMQWMLDASHPRPYCVSNSWGVMRRDLTEGGVLPTVFWDAVTAWRDAGMVAVFASGNDGPGSDEVPGSYPISLAVGALDRRDRVADFTSGGGFEWNVVTYLKPDVAAPGESVGSILPGGTAGTSNGTSMAAPLVAGVVALARQANPGLTPRDAERIVVESCRRIPGQKGRDTRAGEGLVDAVAVVRAARQTTRPVPEPPEGYLAHRADARNNTTPEPPPRPPSGGVQPVVAAIAAGLLAMFLAMFLFYRA